MGAKSVRHVQTTHAHQYHESNPRLELDLEPIDDPSREQRTDEIGNDVAETARVFRDERPDTFPALGHVIPEVGNRIALEYRKNHKGSAIAD